MRFILAALAVLGVFALPVIAQDNLPADFVAAGVSFNQYGTPQISGTGLYAYRLTGADTYSFSLVDIFPNSFRPFRVTNAYTTGVGQRVRAINGVPIFAVGSIGAATAADNTGWAWTAGGLAAIPIGRGFSILPNLRILKSSVSEYQYAVGVMVGWGK
jgi:hypothetical protein